MPFKINVQEHVGTQNTLVISKEIQVFSSLTMRIFYGKE